MAKEVNRRVGAAQDMDDKSLAGKMNAQRHVYGLADTNAVVTTVIDAGLAGYGDDWFNGCYILVIYDAAGGGAAPEGEIQLISDYVSATGTFTTGAFTVAVTANDKFVVMPPERGRLYSDVIGGSGLPSGKSLYDIIGAVYVDGAGGWNLENVADDLNRLGQYLIDGTSGAEAGGTLAAGKSIVDALGQDGNTATQTGDLDATNLQNRIDAIILSLGIVAAAGADGLEEDGTGGTLYDIFNSTDANGNVFDMDGGVAYNDNVFSFLKELSKYVADGDGDFATGQALPSDLSLVDLIETKTAEGTDTLDLPDVVGGIVDAFDGDPAALEPTNLDEKLPSTFCSWWDNNAGATIHYEADLNEIVAGDTVVFTIYKKTDGTTYRLYAQYTYTGDQTLDSVTFEIDCTSTMGVKMGVKQTAGVKRDIPVRFWAVGQNYNGS